MIMNDSAIMHHVLLSAKNYLEQKAFRTSVVAWLIHRRDIVSQGRNQMKTHPLAARFSKHPEAIYIHAELDALLQASKYSFNKWENATLYVARAKYLNDSKKVIIQGIAKPCQGCSAAIAHFGVGRVVFTLDNAGYTVVE